MADLLRLPGILAEIAQVAGSEAALAVAQARGGSKAYFSEQPRDDNWLVAAVGRQAASLIARHFACGTGGVELHVPLGPAAGRARIWREIRRRHRQGQTKPQIARALSICERSVQYHINGHRPLAEEEARQLSLFD